MRSFQHVAGHPSDETIIHSTNTHGIKNIPMTLRDLMLTKEIIGPSNHAIKGKTNRSRPDPLCVTLKS